jgi:putative phage-type endonuclease
MSTDIALFHRRRRSGIGGSDVGAIMGVSPWGNALDVWLAKRAEPAVRKPDNEAQTIGKLIEPTIAALFTQRTSLPVRKGRFLRASKPHDFVIGHPDAVVVGKPEGVEYKNVGLQRSAQFGEQGTDQVPADYLLQCMHYMALTGFKTWWLAALIGGNELRVYRLPWDEELGRLMIDAERTFWESVVSAQPPAMAETSEQAMRLFDKARAGRVEATAEILGVIERYKEAKLRLVEAETDVEQCKLKIMNFMAHSDELVDVSGTVLVTWRQRESTRVDTAALALAHPEIVERFRTATSSRAFLLK